MHPYKNFEKLFNIIYYLFPPVINKISHQFFLRQVHTSNLPVPKTLEIRSLSQLAKMCAQTIGSSTFDIDTTLNSGGNNARPSFILPVRRGHVEQGGSRETNRRRESILRRGEGDWLARNLEGISKVLKGITFERGGD